MIKLVYKLAKPYIYPNLAKQFTPDGQVARKSDAAIYRVQQALPKKWYMVELKAIGKFESADIDIIHHGVAFSLPIRPKKINKRIVYFAKQADSLQLNLTRLDNGTVTVLRLVPIKEDFALARMLKRLSNHPALDKDKFIAKLKKKAELKKQSLAAVVFEAYNKIFVDAEHDNYGQWIEDEEPELIQKAYLNLASIKINPDEYICLLDSASTAVEGSEHLLMGVLAKQASAVIAYADEDSKNEYGIRSNPWFKPDWNHELFLSQDYISSYVVCRKSWYLEHKTLFEAIGTQQALKKLLPKLLPANILHVPLILSHKLLSQSKTSQAINLLEYSKDFLGIVPNLTGAVAHADGVDELCFSIPDPNPLVSLLIPTRNRLSILKPCVESILKKTLYPNFEIIILDNQSNEEDILTWFEQVKLDPRVRVLKYDYPFNYSAINNFGVKHAQGSIIGLINNDVEVISSNWLTEMVSHVCREGVGCVGAKLYYSNGQIQHAGVVLGLGHVAGHAHRFAEREEAGYFNRLNLLQNYSAVTGACLLVQRCIYESVGGLNEQDLAVAYNDVDFCLRVRAAGYRNVWTPHAKLYHHESVSRGEDDTPEKKARFDKEVAYMWDTWAAELKNDPCYNPNLSRLREDFSLREFYN